MIISSTHYYTPSEAIVELMSHAEKNFQFFIHVSQSVLRNQDQKFVTVNSSIPVTLRICIDHINNAYPNSLGLRDVKIRIHKIGQSIFVGRPV